MLYIKLMVTNKKSIVDTHTHTHTHRERNLNITIKVVIKSQGKRAKEKKRNKEGNYKNNPQTVNNMAISTYLLIIINTLN